MITSELRRTVYSSLRTFREHLTGHREEKRKFHLRVGYSLNLHQPRSFNEKVIWKKFHDRNPLLPITADKYRVRGYVSHALMDTALELSLIPLLHVSTNGEDIPFDALPPDYIVKANHGSGMFAIVRGGRVDSRELIGRCKQWLRQSYGARSGEWAYQPIPRKIIVEELLIDENGSIPNDFKFYVFHGKCRLIQIDINRFQSHSRVLCDRHWNYLPVAFNRKKQGAAIEKPPELEQMLQTAELLAADFDFARVDLYSLHQRIYFGEITHYPAGGMGGFTPVEFDFELGGRWTLRSDYWKKRAPFTIPVNACRAL